MRRREPITAADRAYNTRHEVDVQREWIEACLESSRITSWEQGFLESLSEDLDNGWELSERQAEILERIYNERT